MENREIKFRAWDTITKEMASDFVISMIDGKEVDVQYRGFSGRDGFILTQFTGLKDKNGKEIYEGDIVRVLGGSYKIGWSDSRAAWHLIGSTMPLSLSLVDDERLSIEIIGNIYENPELLK